MTGSGGSPGAGSGTVTVWGSNKGSSYCETNPPRGQAKVHAGGNGHTSSSVIVAVGQITNGDLASCGFNANWLSVSSRYGTNPQSYSVNFLNTGSGEFVGVGPVREYVRDCMTGGHPSTFKTGTLSINNGVGGPATFVINGHAESPDLPGMESALFVCGPGNNAEEGLVAPITVI